MQDLGVGALSIEEQRAKTEQDEKLRQALEKKNLVLKKLDYTHKARCDHEGDERA
jgi:hypothetical protein